MIFLPQGGAQHWITDTSGANTDQIFRNTLIDCANIFLNNNDKLLIPFSYLLSHCCRENNSGNTILHSPHTGTRQHKLADMPNILQSAYSLIHSLLLLATLLFLCATAVPGPVPISQSFCPPAFLGHWAPPIFIHTMPCFVFMLAQWGMEP